MGDIKAVVFDIGRVLIEWNPEGLYDQQIGVAKRRAFFEEVDIFGMNERVDRGADLWAEANALAEIYPDFRAEILLWHDRWIDMVPAEITWSVLLLRVLKTKGVPVYALSNFGVRTFQMAEEKYPVLKEFDQKYISGDLQMMKPDAEIYRALEVGSGMLPRALLFTDDVPENIATAKARGWQAHLFEGPRGWAQKLCDHGVLTASEAGL